MQAAPGSKRGRPAKRGWQSGHLGDTAPGPHQFLLAPLVARTVGTGGELCKPVGWERQGGRRKVRLCSTVPLLRPTSHLSDQGPWDTPRSTPGLWALAHLVPSYFLFSSVFFFLWPRSSQFPMPVTWGCKRFSWPLQGAAGEAGNATTAGD